MWYLKGTVRMRRILYTRPPRGQASFNLRKLVTSSPTLQGQINREDIPQKSTSSQAAEPTNIEAMEESYIEATLPSATAIRPGEQRVLGVCWNIQCDQLVFEFSGIANAAALLMPTKRNVISKVFMQALFKSHLKVKW